MAKKDNRKNILSYDDKKIWKQVIKNIIPLKKDVPINAESEYIDDVGDDIVADIITKDTIKEPHEKAGVLENKAPKTGYSKGKPAKRSIHLGMSADIDKATFSKFKRGNLPIGARIDLHGYSKDKALQKLLGDIPTLRKMQKRCILIITGKGKGILRQNLDLWLNHENISPHILSYIQAQPKDGGEGAFYILLRKN